MNNEEMSPSPNLAYPVLSYHEIQKQLKQTGQQFQQFVIPIHPICEFVDEILNGFRTWGLTVNQVLTSAIREVIYHRQRQGGVIGIPLMGEYSNETLSLFERYPNDASLIRNLITQLMFQLEDYLGYLPFERIHSYEVDEEGRYLMVGLLVDTPP